MALTATATTRVREDIVKLLRLREPQCFVASFNRPNLTYRVVAKNKPGDQVLAFLRARPRESGIVYCQSRKSAENLANQLTRHGITRPALSRRADCGAAQRKSGTFPARRRAGYLRDHRFRHGHQQTKCPLCHSL